MDGVAGRVPGQGGRAPVMLCSQTSWRFRCKPGPWEQSGLAWVAAGGGVVRAAGRCRQWMLRSRRRQRVDTMRTWGPHGSLFPFFLRQKAHLLCHGNGHDNLLLRGNGSRWCRLTDHAAAVQLFQSKSYTVPGAVPLLAIEMLNGAGRVCQVPRLASRGSTGRHPA